MSLLDKAFQESVETQVLNKFNENLKQHLIKLFPILEDLGIKEESWRWYCGSPDPFLRHEFDIKIAIEWHSSTELPVWAARANMYTPFMEFSMVYWIDDLLTTLFRQTLRKQFIRHFSPFVLLPVQALDAIVLDYLF